MKVAIVHDTLTEFGGAERVLTSLLSIYPSADIYTAYLDEKLLQQHFSSIPRSRFHASFIQQFHLGRYGYLFQCISPIVWMCFNLESYDLVISCSAFFLSNMISVKKPFHLKYIHAPPKNIFNLATKTSMQKLLPFAAILGYLYKRNLLKHSYNVTNSRNTKRTLWKLGKIRSIVIYPPIQIPSKTNRAASEYFLIVSRLTPEKNIELAIKACNKLNAKLVIAGTSSDLSYEAYLRQISGPTIRFLGFCSDRVKRTLYTKAKAFLFTSESEDFGIAPLEAIAHGVPVIAYHGGGAKEYVINKVTGLFYYSLTETALRRAILSFHSKTYNPNTLHRSATRFSEQQFKQNIKTYISSSIKDN